MKKHPDWPELRSDSTENRLPGIEMAFKTARGFRLAFSFFMFFSRAISEFLTKWHIIS